MEIREDDLEGREMVALLREHVEEMRRISPPGSSHALDLEALRSPGITFWSIWDEDELIGCGALKQLDSRSGEIKSMRTVPAHRGRGVASVLLRHIETVARNRGYERLLLETGSFPAFASARALYLRHGFEFRDPFAGYSEDPNSVFMEKKL